ncbi:phosphoenolpyruvate synthase [Streptomyces djakartensis]|uniref:Phosphoenolpyruvate synthase n=1 Tax=Streptomyces djakartensis TaxID=68193 RepID=A0ABQ2Z4M9_9ACTN|nr:phosphoenolpyruvate synthase [Streptomyces djakartensis]GGY01335.1 phosphoenolpyruvate synthase [Streptomyces djakartensis]
MSLTVGSGHQAPHVLTPLSDEAQVVELAGGKGRNLHILTAAGFQVPSWSVIGLDVFEEFSRGSELAECLQSLRAAEGRPDRAGEVAAEIATLIDAAPLGERVIEAIAEAYRQAGGGLVAVRSSGAEEDGAEHSFAGQFDSFLNVSGLQQVAAHVRRCWASGFSERSLRYRAQRGLPPGTGGVAVIVQRMVPAERSGVLFTADPVTGRTDRHVISAVHGLGEGLVSGAVDADTVVLDAATGEPLSTVIGDKQERYDAGGRPGCEVSPVADEDREALSLTADDLALLHAAGVRATEHYGAPQDIEWAIAEGTLWILQSRPVTALGPAAGTAGEPAGELRVWDNSNIIESFSGVVSPLTYSFAADTYAKVYESYARALGVKGDQLREVQEWTPHLLGYVHGRVYYNLYHWYRMVRLAPLYRLNRRVLEKSLGVAESVSDEAADALHPFTPRPGLRGRVSRLARTVVFAHRFLTIGRSMETFHRNFYRAYEVFNNVDYDALPGDETYRRFRRLQRELIEKWGPMQALDATILLSVGMLALLTRKWLPDAPEWFTWAAAAPGSDVESAEPARALSALAARVRADDGLRRLLENTTDEDAYAALRDGGHTGFLAAVDAYITDYGYRSPDELKLEVPDLYENPAGLFTLLRDALPGSTSGAAGARGNEADAYLDERLRGPRRWVYERVRRKARAALTDRERLRFCRTRAFGSVKRMLRAMGRDLARSGAIDAWDDVFMLRLEEVRGAYEGMIAHSELRELAALRRRRLAADAELHAPSRFTTRGAPYWSGNLERAGWAGGPAARSGARELRGTPCCPGVVEGLAVVTDTPRDIGGGILLTYRTDPGWVAALPSAAALVIERGSPLTHVAVVARELGIPTVVQVKNATTEIGTGARLRVDGAAGTVTVLADPPGDGGAP